MHFWYQQGNKTLPGLYFQWGCWDTNQSDLVQALKHSVQVRKKLKCTILLHSCKMFRRLVEGIRCWRWTETAATKVVVNSPIFVDWNRKWTADPTTNQQNKCWHCALCTNHGLPFSFFAALLHKGLTTSPGVLKMIRCVTWSAAGHVVRNHWNHGCIFCHFIYYLTLYSSGKMMFGCIMFHGALAVLRHLSDYMLISFRDGENKRGDVRALFLFEIILFFSPLLWNSEQNKQHRLAQQHRIHIVLQFSAAVQFKCSSSGHPLFSHLK